MDLLITPEKFHGKPIRVTGLAKFAFEGNTICTGADPAATCFWLDVEGVMDPGFRKAWATIEGHFDGEGRGHLGCCAGTIGQITKLERLR